MKHNVKVVTILGQTASGKSDLAVHLAKRFQGEVVSADSRQVYKEFNLTSGKISKEEMQGVKHHLLDVASVLDGKFSALKFKELAENAVSEIIKKGHLPIIAGGTGFYTDVLLGNVFLDELNRDEDAIKELESKSLDELREELLQLSKDVYNKTDLNNKIKVARAVERLKFGTGKKIEPMFEFDTLYLGIKWPKTKLRERIHIRLLQRHKAHMCDEVDKLIQQGVPKDLFEELGLEMRYCKRLVLGEISEDEFLLELENKIWQYAKRQNTYFKRNKNIIWLKPQEKLEDVYEEAERMLVAFL